MKGQGPRAMKFQIRARGADGFALLSMVVVSALIAMAVAFMLQPIELQRRALAQHAMKGRKADMRDVVLQQLDCAKTVNAINRQRCDHGDFIELFNQRGTAFVPQFDETQLEESITAGDMALRARCQSRGGRFDINIEVRAMTDAGVAAKDPLTKRRDLWTDLYDGVPVSCSKPLKLNPDYEGCASLVNQGFRGYPSQCPLGHAVTIINDGQSETMTCCPMDLGVFASDGAGNQPIFTRDNICAANELLVGMQSSAFANPVRVQCSPIDVSQLALTAPQTSQLVLAYNYPEGSFFRQVIEQYRISDTCACPNPFAQVMIGAPGGHVWIDNQCQEHCVSLRYR